MANPIILKVLILIVSIFLLLKGADLFSDFAEKLAIKLKIPYFIIGITIVAFGTSLPELFSSIMSINQGVPELAIGDILGSNITNIFLVLGVATLFMKEKIVKIGYDLLHVDLPYFVGAAFLVTMMLMDQKISIVESFILIAGLVLYLSYSVSVRKNITDQEVKSIVSEEHAVGKLSVMNFVLGGLGLVGLLLGSRYFVSTLVELSNHFELDIEILALTIVPLTSNLPELIITVRNAIKGNSELVVGNILGSNIFNIFGILGVSSLFGPVFVSESFSFFILPILILATILYFFITQEKQITKWEGGLLLLAYVTYIYLTYHFLA